MSNDVAATRERRAAWDGGKCRVPMWSMGGPAGLCGEKALGPQYPKAYLRALNGYANPPYCFGPCCPSHGGPKEGEPILFMDGTDTDGRPMWCAVMPGFINLQESHAAFNRDPVLAVKNLLLCHQHPRRRRYPMIKELRDRVRGLKGADREVDTLIIKSLGFHSWAGRMSYRDADGVRMWDFGSSEITGSADAALAFSEKVLGTYSLRMTVGPSGNGADLVWWPKGLSDHENQVVASAAGTELALAIIDATLTALIETME